MTYLLFTVLFAVAFAIFSRATGATVLRVVDLQNSVLEVTPSIVLHEHFSEHNPKDVFLCERVKVVGYSRFILRSYPNVLHVAVNSSSFISERLHSRIRICFHRNASLGLCQCEQDKWRTLQKKGLWCSVMSPYDVRFVDVNYLDKISGAVRVSVKEEPQTWRILFLASGFFLILLAPIISRWAPFYYSSSMTIGVFLVVIIILFQGMKLLPTGRKNIFYLSLYGSLLGAGTFILHYISAVVKNVLINFGLSEDMHNPVCVFMIVIIILSGAALGYWIVRKFVITKDGSVDVGIAQFVKWAMRTIAATFIFQSTHDTPFALASLVSCCLICYLFNSIRKCHVQYLTCLGGRRTPCLQQVGYTTPLHNRAEFLHRSGGKSSEWPVASGPKSLWPRSNSPIKGGRNQARTYYSTFHKILNRKKLSKQEWESSTKDSTRRALAEWAASPQVATWLMDNADRIQLLPPDDDASASSASGSYCSDSADDDDVRSNRNWFGLFS